MIDEKFFEKQDWSNPVYVTDDTNLKEALPGNMPEPQGKDMTVSAYMGADYAEYSVTRRSQTRFLIYLNLALMYWHSKKQTSVATSTFERKFMAMKNYKKYIIGLQFKL